MRFPALIAVVSMAFASPATARWREAETAHFRVYGSMSESAIRERAAVLEDFRSLLAKLTTGKAGPEAAPRLDIFIVDKLAQSRPFGKAPVGAAGYYTANAGRIAAYAEDRDAGQFILLHEYAHHFMLGSGAVAYPRWYVEGFAEYFGTATFRADRIEFGLANPARVSWLVRAAWLPLDRLLSRTPDLNGSFETSTYYAQAWLLTHYMFRVDAMADKFKAYLAAVAAGADPVAAFKDKINPDLDHFQYTLKKYLRGHDISYTRFDRPKATPAAVTVIELPPSADEFLLAQASLELGLPVQYRKKALETVRADAAKFPDDPLALRTLAMAELRYGDSDRAIAILDPLLAANPDDATLLRWRALADHPYRATTPPDVKLAAQRLLVRSFKADPNDWRTMLDFVQLFQPMRQTLIPSTLNVLLRTYELAPQVSDVVLATAVALARADRLAEAGNVLAPLAYSAHPGPDSVRAETLLPLARAGDKPAFLRAISVPVRAVTPPAEKASDDPS